VFEWITLIQPLKEKCQRRNPVVQIADGKSRHFLVIAHRPCHQGLQFGYLIFTYFNPLLLLQVVGGGLSVPARGRVLQFIVCDPICRHKLKSASNPRI
jgi:hypothetical protein